MTKLQEYYDLLEGRWNDIAPRLPRLFTTQDFQRIIEEHAPDVWARFVERWGPGGKGSGNFYSPANPLNTYLKRKTSEEVLINNRFVQSAPGWGSVVVNQWQFANEIEGAILPPEEDWEFVEGKQRWRSHLIRERHEGVRKKLLAARGATGLFCDVCGVKGDNLSADIRDAMFEAHHSTEPMANGERKTKLKDLSLLCATCHRLLHRLVARKGEWVTVDEAKKTLHPNRPHP